MDAHLSVEFFLGDSRIGESDFSLHEFIPLVRQVTRDLAVRRGMTETLQGYRAFIVPRCEGELSETEYVAKALFEGRSDSDGVPVRIAISEDDSEGKVSYNDEIQAYFNVGTSHLCTNCPERERCPGSGLATSTVDLYDWIQLRDEGALNKGEILFFSLEILGKDGTLLFAKDFHPQVLQAMIRIACEEMAKQVNLAFTSERLIRAKFRFLSGPALPPKTLTQRRQVRVVVAEPREGSSLAERGPVDWGRIQRPSPLQGQVPLVPSWNPPLIKIGLDKTPADKFCVGVTADELSRLHARTAGNKLAEFGVILGGHVRDTRGRIWVAAEEFGPLFAATGGASLLFNPSGAKIDHIGSLGGILSQLGRFLAGWYRMDSDDKLARSARQGELFSASERELHETLFSEPWHIAYVGSISEGTARFYRSEGGRMIQVPYDVVTWKSSDKR